MNHPYVDNNGDEWPIPEGWTIVEDLEKTIVLDEDGKQYTLQDAARYATAEAAADLVPHQFDGIDQDGNAIEIKTRQAMVPAPVHTWLDSDPESLQNALEVRKTNRENVMEWIREALIDGTDFGRIHVVKRDKCDKGNQCTNPYHYSKRCLWKAGAEKIVGMLGLRAEWPDLADARYQAMQPGCKFVILRCHLINPDGVIVSEGIGGRSMDDDYCQVNKVFKMAKKSALIDAVLNAAGMSEVFTQDIVDDDSQKTVYETTLDEDGVRYLQTIATEMFGDQGRAVVASLCRRRFGIDSGDPSLIPAFRLQDAIRSLEEKASGEMEQTDGEG